MIENAGTAGMTNFAAGIRQAMKMRAKNLYRRRAIENDCIEGNS